MTVIHEGAHKAPQLVLRCCCMRPFRLPHFLRWLLFHPGILPKPAFRLHRTPDHICWRSHTHLASRHVGLLTRWHLLGQRDRLDSERLVRPERLAALVAPARLVRPERLAALVAPERLVRP